MSILLKGIVVFGILGTEKFCQYLVVNGPSYGKPLAVEKVESPGYGCYRFKHEY